MKKTDQEEFNEVVFESIEGLRDALKTGSASRDVLLKIIKFEGTRLDSLDNKVDILMSERAELTPNENWELDSITDETTITPRALIELGFHEVYQDVDLGDPGYIFYSKTINGIDFLSMDTDAEDFYVIVGEDFKVKNLGKLRNFIIALKELS